MDWVSCAVSCVQYSPGPTLALLLDKSFAGLLLRFTGFPAKVCGRQPVRLEMARVRSRSTSLASRTAILFCRMEL